MLWKIMSYSWTEIGIEPEEYCVLAKEAGINLADLADVDRVIFRDITASFAVDSFLIFPLFLWMIMPDWEYDEIYLKNRVRQWYTTPYVIHLLHPLRILGYPIALIFVLSSRSKLRDAVRKNARA